MRGLDEFGLVVRAVESEADVLAASRLARAEGHHAVAPTHLVERDGVVVGYASVNAVPILTGCLSRAAVTQEEGRAVIALLEDLLRAQGAAFACLPCTDDCRFADDMAAMGYRRSGRVTLNFKNLT